MSTALGTEGRGRARFLADWWRSRYGARMLGEIAIVAALLITYRTIRTFNRTDLSAAFTHATEVVRFESWFGLPFEDNLQGFLLEPSAADQDPEPLLHLVPLPGRDPAAGVAVHVAPQELRGRPEPDGVLDVHRARSSTWSSRSLRPA